MRCLLFIFLLGLVFSKSVFGQIEVTDDLGVTHRFNAPVKRVISLMPHATEMLFEVGAGKQVVGAVEYSDFPESAKKIPRVGGYSGLNIEVILTLKPDLIISWPGGNPSSDLNQVKKLGIPMYASDPKTFKDIADNLDDLGKLTGHAIEGKAVADRLYNKAQALRLMYANNPKVRVFYQVWNKPLMTLNANSFISKSIELCGGQNVFADLLTVAAQISLESVIKANPDAIVTGGHTKQREEWLLQWQKVADLKAVKYGNVFQIPPDVLQRPTSRLYEGTRLLCQALDEARHNLGMSKVSN